MGQQQLLLLVLGIVIVGLAVVVGINAFSENRIKSNADALVTDGLRIASDIQAAALKPTQFGGFNDGNAATDDLNGAGDRGPIFLSDIGYTPDSGTGLAEIYSNVNGEYSRTAPTGITLCPTPGTGVVLYGSNADTDNCVVITISGTSADDIDTQVEYGT